MCRPNVPRQALCERQRSKVACTRWLGGNLTDTGCLLPVSACIRTLYAQGVRYSEAYIDIVEYLACGNRKIAFMCGVIAQALKFINQFEYSGLNHFMLPQ